MQLFVLPCHWGFAFADSTHHGWEAVFSWSVGGNPGWAGPTACIFLHYFILGTSIPMDVGICESLRSNLQQILREDCSCVLGESKLHVDFILRRGQHLQLPCCSRVKCTYKIKHYWKIQNKLEQIERHPIFLDQLIVLIINIFKGNIKNDMKNVISIKILFL